MSYTLFMCVRENRRGDRGDERVSIRSSLRDKMNDEIMQLITTAVVCVVSIYMMWVKSGIETWQMTRRGVNLSRSLYR